MSTSFESRFSYSDFLDSPQERLNRLKQLLDFKYEPSSIWKELLQNAEDSGATQLHFAVLPAPQAKSITAKLHPFEHAPILCAINNGIFSPDDATAIARMGLGTKGANEDAIGKFGLGMKSVYNLGEVLFYFASPTQAASRHQHPDDETACFGKALNPYAELKVNSGWDLDDGRKRGPLMRRLLDRLRMQNWCKVLESGQDARWFALMLPLRSEEFAPRGSALVQNYPTPESLFPTDLEERLVALFPLLRNLESVTVWREIDTKQPWFRVTLQVDARRPQKPSELRAKEGLAQEFGGKVEAAGKVRRFEGREIRLDLAQFAATQIEERAQTSYQYVEGETQAQLRREKFAPHAAAAWIQGAQAGVLHLRPAVSLPLPDRRDLSGGASDAQDIAMASARGFQLTLHGNFFIDDGRRNLVLNAFHQGEETPHSKWNKQLLAQGTLPLVLPALEGFLKSIPLAQKPNDWEVRELTRALGKANWLVENSGASLTLNGNWLYKLSGPIAPDMTVSALKRKAVEKTTSVGAWHRENENAFWVVPAPPEGEAAGVLENPAAKVFEWLPGLAVVAKKHNLVWDWPRFTREKSQAWSEEQILALLKGATGKTLFESPFSVRYFVSVLQSFGSETLSKTVWERVIKLAQEGLRAFPFGTRLKDEVVTAWREFWGFVPQIYWLPLEMGTKADREERRPKLASDFMNGLLSLDLERISVPTDLAPPLLPEAEKPQWVASDARKVAQWFAFLFSKPSEPLGDLVRPNHLLEATQGDTEAKFEAIGAFPLFKTKEWRNEEDPETGKIRSWEQLRELKSQQRLWVDVRDGGKEWLRDWCRAVDVAQKTADGGHSFIVSIEEGADRAYSRALWPRRDEQPQSFGPKACLDLLQSRPVLRDVTGRAALVPRLFDALKTDRSTENRCAVRFLLHGRPEVFHDSQTPLFKAVRGGEVWHRLASIAIPQDRQWTLIGGELSERIADDVAGVLEVRSLDKTGALDLLRECQSQIPRLRFDFSADERRQILRDLTDNPNDQSLFRALPLHEVRYGTGIKLASLPDRCYLEGAKIEVPPELQKAQTLVAQPNDSSLKARYIDFGIGEFEAQSVLELALLHPTPHVFTATILKTLDVLDWEKIDPDIKGLLAEVSWIQAASGAAFAPAQVIHLPAISARVEMLCQSEIAVAATVLERKWGEHKGWKKVTALWPQPIESARLLRGELRQRQPHHEPFWIGVNFGSSLPNCLPRFLEGWQASGATLPPGVALLQTLCERDATVDAGLEIASALMLPVPIETLATWGRAVSLAAKSAFDADRRNPVVGVHFWLFEALTKHPDARQSHITSWFFPSQTGAWSAPEKLTRNAKGVQNAVILHTLWAEALEGQQSLCQSRGSRQNTARSDAWAEMEREMASWNTTDALKGALAAVLGGIDPRCEKLCLNGFGGDPQARLNVWKKLGGVSNSAQSDLQKSQNNPFYFAFAEGIGKVAAPNLLGEMVDFPLEEHEFSSLLVSNIESTGSGWHLQLRRVREHSKSRARDEMNILLIETLRELLQKRDELDGTSRDVSFDDQHQVSHFNAGRTVEYRLSGSRFDACVNEWTRAEQIDLEVAQSFLLDNSFLYFRTLGGQIGPKTAQLGREYDLWRYERHSQIEVVNYGQRRSTNREELAAKREAIFEKLRLWAESDAQFGQETLDMVRRKISDCGYDVASVPFELFQNADDAASERGEAGLDDVATSRLSIAVDSAQKRVTWTHWGRKMNVKGAYGRISLDTAIERGYGRDLEKMLILQASDKSGQNFTTGKFGLGFKSVYLVSDLPRVESGELRFEVRGGFYPQSIGGGGEIDREATQMRFDLSHSDMSEVFGLFWRVLPLQMVFGRTLRECDFRFDHQTFHFKPTHRKVGAEVEVVEWGHAAPWPLSIKGADSGQNNMAPLPDRILLLGNSKDGLLALSLSKQGIEKLPSDIPCFWATTPTRVPVHPGFALNAEWQLDVGRVQLAGGTPNQECARNLGVLWRDALEAMVAQSRDWPAFRDQLELDSSVTRAGFWRKVAALFASLSVQNDVLLSTIFSPKNGALVALKEWIPVTATTSSPSSVIGVSEVEERELPLQSRPNFLAIASWWQTAQVDHFPTPEGPFFPSGLIIYTSLDARNKEEQRLAWLTLLLRSSLESVGRTSEAQKSGFIAFCAQKGGWLERFASPQADVSKLGVALEQFLENDANNHQWLYLLRHSLPVFALSRWLKAYIEIFTKLDSRKKFGDMNFLKPRLDTGFGLLIDVPDAPQLGHVLGRGSHFLLRELVRVGFVEDPRAHALCFHPTASLRRVLEPFDARFASDQQNSLDASKLAHAILTQHLNERAHFDLCFDIPLVLWAQGKADL